MTAKSTVHNLPTKVLGPNRDLTNVSGGLLVVACHIGSVLEWP